MAIKFQSTTTASKKANYILNDFICQKNIAASKAFRVMTRRQMSTRFINEGEVNRPHSSKILILLNNMRIAWIGICLLILIVRVESFVKSTVIQHRRGGFTKSLPSLAFPPSTRSNVVRFGIKGFRSWFERQFPDAIVAFPKDGTQQGFDHVLIDMNQMLHVVLRRSRSDEHALVLLMKELDATLRMATPYKSLVLAIDGSPAAAKLATQRRRRFSSLVRSEWKMKNFERFSHRFTKTQREKRLRSYKSDIRTLRITPGTDFMKMTEDALLYWAWQRLQHNSKSFLKTRGVRIYISPSTVPGEGEVKILDWILQKKVSGSVAILGGDSDLVLEGLVVPPQLTHNVFVLLPEGKSQYLSVSLWETTRALAQFLPHLPADAILQVRTDLVLLMVMNGNDYLPKLRGGKKSGFSNIFHTYLRLIRDWHHEEGQVPCLIDPDTLEFHLPFCIAFFRKLARRKDIRLNYETDSSNETNGSNGDSDKSALMHFNTMADSGFLPQPIEWEIMINSRGGSNGESFTGEEHESEVDKNKGDNNISEYSESVLKDDEKVDDDQNNDKGNEEAKLNQDFVRLNLGVPGTEDFYQYEIRYSGGKIKDTKHDLAMLALEDIMGPDYFVAEEDEDGISKMTTSGYSWENRFAAEGRVDLYLSGLIWNLQTYQDGICADYAYNYGKRRSPSADDIVKFMKKAQAENRTLGHRELLGGNFSTPVTAGLSCLAALPSQVQDLVPEPYKWLPPNLVEKFYAESMASEDNMFDLKKFEDMIENEVSVMQKTRDDSASDDKLSIHGRRILMGDHYWTVLGRTMEPLKHAFDPPLPFDERLARLRSDDRIMVSRLFATSKPRSRSSWCSDGANKEDDVERPQRYPTKYKSFRNSKDEVKHFDFGSLLAGDKRIQDVNYMVAYRNEKKQKAKKKRLKVDVPCVEQHAEKIITDTPATTGNIAKDTAKRKVKLDIAARMKKFKIVSPPKNAVMNADGQTALACLKQLEDIGLIGMIEWTITSPSKSSYASFDPDGHEHICLTVRRGEQDSTSVLRNDLTYEQDRENDASRKALKQHLASLALCDITGPQRRWSELKFSTLKRYLQNRVDADFEKIFKVSS